MSSRAPPPVTLCLIATLLLAPLARPAAALSGEAKARAEAKALEAKFKFKAEDYAGAATLFLQAFTVSRSPALLYNAARAFEEAGKLKQARAAFEQYLGLRGLTKAGRRDAKAKVTDLSRRITKQATAAKSPTASQRPTTSGQRANADRANVDRANADRANADRANADRDVKPHTAQPDDPEGAKSSAQTPPLPETGVAQPARPPSRALTWALIGGGSGLALLGLLGMAGAAQAQTDANQNTDWAAPNARVTYATAADDAEATWTGSAFIALVGVGAAVWGVVRLRSAPAPSQPGVAWSPTLMTLPRGQATTGVTVRGRF